MGEEAIGHDAKRPVRAFRLLKHEMRFGCGTLGHLPVMSLAAERRRSLDAALVAWVIVWCVLGFWVGREVHRLGGVTGSVRGAGGAIVDAGDAISGLKEIPLVGGAVSAPGDEIAAAGRSAQAGADDARAGADRLAWLLGLSIALIPTLPVLAVYLPPRLTIERDRRAVAAVGDDVLARRALVHLPLHRLAAVSADPVGDMERGEVAALAAAERRRLGLEPY
jgi:hypothetical protein